jgi:transcriptional regulator with XRE-family HTH domain
MGKDIQIRDEVLLWKIATKLKELRTEKKVSQLEVSNSIQIHIGRIESAKANVSVSTLSKLCDYFGISMSKFFGDIEKMPAPKKKK